MTELYIEHQLAVLSKNTSISLKVENPFFTDTGEYTYDIQLDMAIPENQKIFGFRHRHNISTVAKDKYSYQLVVDHRVLSSGTLTITDISNDSIKVQLLSGNSELNYLIGNDLTISSLDMGTADIRRKQTWPVDGADNGYPTDDYCLMAVYNRSADLIVNRLSTGRTGSEADVMDDTARYVPQPYLLFYLKRLIQALGYTVGRCDLDGTEYQNLVICHTHPTREYAKMLPGWTVYNFLKELDNLLNVKIIVDNRKKTVDVVSTGAFYLNATQQNVTNVLDAFSGDVDDENRVERSSCTVQYSTPDNTYYKRRVISDDALQSFDIAEYATSAEAAAALSSSTPRRICKGKDSGQCYGLDLSDRVEDIGIVQQKEDLDTFHPLVNMDTDETVDCKMCPVELSYVGFRSSRENERSDARCIILFPTIDGETTDDDDEDEDSTETVTAVTLIDGTEEKSEGNDDNIFLAFYKPIQANAFEDGWSKEYYRMGYTDAVVATTIPAFVQKNFSTSSSSSRSPGAVSGDTVSTANVTKYITGAEGSLRLSAISDNVYHDLYVIDSMHAKTFEIEDINYFDVRKIFIIRNKRYICKEIEYTLTENGRSRKWKGTFYPIAMADNEAFKRWILEDGHWNDGGIYIDDGRWNDS